MDTIVVNDTNIFIDLISINALEQIFKLPIKFHTVDSVIEEITDKIQRELVLRIVSNGNLVVKEFDAIEFSEVISLFNECRNNVSVTDCSVWYYAKRNNYRLITGDGKLRSCATSDGVIVSGILYITDMLVECGIISKEDMAARLEELSRINKRLPKRLIEERVSKYK